MVPVPVGVPRPPVEEHTRGYGRAPPDIGWAGSHVIPVGEAFPSGGVGRVVARMCLEAVGERCC